VDRNFYRFRTQWDLNAPPADVFEALAELTDYPNWWPEVRTVTRLTGDEFQLRCRSLLPYDLNFVSRPVRRDRDDGLLEAHLAGDLDGFSRWTITGAGTGTVAVFEEEVVANKALLRRLALIARPAFQANHVVMMRHGRRGLRTYLAGMRLGRRGPA
jgi:hypothetical protein